MFRKSLMLSVQALRVSSDMPKIWFLALMRLSDSGQVALLLLVKSIPSRQGP